MKKETDFNKPKGRELSSGAYTVLAALAIAGFSLLTYNYGKNNDQVYAREYDVTYEQPGTLNGRKVEQSLQVGPGILTIRDVLNEYPPVTKQCSRKDLVESYSIPYPNPLVSGVDVKIVETPNHRYCQDQKITYADIQKPN